MGKAHIKENLENAQYKIELLLDKTSLQKLIDSINVQITELQEKISAIPD